jgi:hypothetical protein
MTTSVHRAEAVPVTYHRTTGHFALEDKADEMVALIRDFLGRKVALL